MCGPSAFNCTGCNELIHTISRCGNRCEAFGDLSDFIVDYIETGPLCKDCFNAFRSYHEVISWVIGILDDEAGFLGPRGRFWAAIDNQLIGDAIHQDDDHSCQALNPYNVSVPSLDQFEMEVDDLADRLNNSTTVGVRHTNHAYAGCRLSDLDTYSETFTGVVAGNPRLESRVRNISERMKIADFARFTEFQMVLDKYNYESNNLSSPVDKALTNLVHSIHHGSTPETYQYYSDVDSESTYSDEELRSITHGKRSRDLRAALSPEWNVELSDRLQSWLMAAGFEIDYASWFPEEFLSGQSETLGVDDGRHVDEVNIRGSLWSSCGWSCR